MRGQGRLHDVQEVASDLEPQQDPGGLPEVGEEDGEVERWSPTGGQLALQGQGKVSGETPGSWTGLQRHSGEYSPACPHDGGRGRGFSEHEKDQDDLPLRRAKPALFKTTLPEFVSRSSTSPHEGHR